MTGDVPHILVTNDDGVMAPGLLALVQAMRSLGKVTILAPDRNWSASGHVKTMHRPLRVKEVRMADDTPALATDGSPSDCVTLAALGVVTEKIDLVVSGINPNANLGDDVTYSGTVTAAMEAVIWEMPGIAVSLDSSFNHNGPRDFKPAAQVAGQVAAKVIRYGLPPGNLINVNVPYLPFDEIKGWQITRQGIRVYRDALDRRVDPRGEAYYWIGGEAPTGVPDEGTDVGALAAGYVSVNPLHLDLTDYQVMDHVRRWT